MDGKVRRRNHSFNGASTSWRWTDIWAGTLVYNSNGSCQRKTDIYSGGALVVNGTYTSATGEGGDNITVHPGGTLAGSGVVAVANGGIVDSFGTIAPAGTLTIMRR